MDYYTTHYLHRSPLSSTKYTLNSYLFCPYTLNTESDKILFRFTI